MTPPKRKKTIPRRTKTPRLPSSIPIKKKMSQTPSPISPPPLDESILVETDEPPLTFHAFGIPSDIIRSLDEHGYTIPTPIQHETIPLIQDGKDVLGQAKTGTGKTAAFGIPILQHVDPTIKSPQALIVVPTRELALQVKHEIQKIGKHTPAHVVAVFGGANMNAQITELKRGAHIVVGTPGRIMDFLRQKVLNLSRLRVVVLDEADKMLDMGFVDDIETILSYAPKERQTLLFSATMPSGIKKLARKHMRDFLEVNLSQDTLTVENIIQYFVNVDPKQRVSTLLGLVHQFDVTRGIIFCSTKRTVDWLAHQLERRRFPVAKIHGDMTQAQRERNLRDFKEGKFPLLLATNVASRGIHVEDISHVINFDFPEEYETYIHRIGRTARQGRKGIAVTFVTNMAQQQQLKELELLMNAKVHEIRAK
ncbi:MAG: DEAD/DEAH box helicase [Candidatus Diapherotrites archaeon]|nr:DEAD/DEAH box helicase [Candidatus Diapherotrites archaeon]MDZ4256708.1 DEAD/DEAH box helicase [archaeon]